MTDVVMSTPTFVAAYTTVSGVGLLAFMRWGWRP